MTCASRCFPQLALRIGVVWLLLSGCATTPYVVRDHQVLSSDPKTDTFYVVRHGWHTGIIVAGPDLDREIPELRERFINKQYYEIGWGDAEYYQASEPGSGLTLQAALWPTATVLHVVGFSNQPALEFPSSRIEKVHVSQNGYRNLLAFLKNSFHFNESGRLVSLKKGHYGDSQFYMGTGSFYLCNNCNKWTAKGLASAGLDGGVTWKLTADQALDAATE